MRAEAPRDPVGRDRGAGARWALGGLLAAAWIATPLCGNRIDQVLSEGPSHLGPLAWTGGMLLIAGLVALFGRRRLRGAPWTGRALAVAVLALFAQLFLLGGSWLLLVYAEAALVLVCFLWFVVTGVFALALELRLLPAAVVYFAAFLVAARWPRHRYLLLAGANFVLCANVALAWRGARRRAAVGAPARGGVGGRGTPGAA